MGVAPKRRKGRLGVRFEIHHARAESRPKKGEGAVWGVRFEIHHARDGSRFVERVDVGQGENTNRARGEPPVCDMRV